MNVASKGLCQELFEVSGWEDTMLVICQSGSYREKYGSYSEEGWFAYDINEAVRHHLNEYPYYVAYDLGYLLRRLPGIVELHKYANGLWSCDTDGFGYEQAETPEDAVCKLAIELFKQGILSRSMK